MRFDGHDLASMFIVGEPEFSTFVPSHRFEDVSGRDGSVFMGGKLNGGTITVPLTIVDKDMEKRRSTLSNLYMILDVDEPKLLVMPEVPDLAYKAIPQNAVKESRYIDGDTVTVTFQLTEAAAYGNTVTLTVPSGGSVTFNVDGTYPTKPTITANAVRNSSSLVWGLRLDDGDFLHVQTGAAAARSIVLDCENRTLTVQGAVALPTLDSDWFALTPGEHTITMDNGTGAATITYQERWL